MNETEMAISIKEKVVIELEKRKCIYMTMLKCFGDAYAFPWAESILRKLQGGVPNWKLLLFKVERGHGYLAIML